LVESDHVTFRWGKPLTRWKKGIVGSWNRKSRGLEGETAGEWEKGSRAHTTGSHVIWKGKPLTRWKKGIVGSWNRKSRGLEGETAGEWEKRIAGSYNRKSRDLEGETADQVEKRNRGLIQPEVTWFGRGNRWRV